MKLNDIEGLEDVQVYKAENGRWYGDVTFVTKTMRALPDGWIINGESARAVVSFVAPHGPVGVTANGRIQMTDDEARHDVSAQVAQFLLKCYALDQQEKVTRKLMKKRLPKETRKMLKRDA